MKYITFKNIGVTPIFQTNVYKRKQVHLNYTYEVLGLLQWTFRTQKGSAY